MTNGNREHPNNNDEADRHLEESVSSGRITQSEADVVRLFFASQPLGNWPATDLQRRMQGSGG
jgi:hypothetical protein